MSEIRYLLDEHINPRMRRALLRRASGMMVWCIGDSGAPTQQSQDPDILRWCELRGFILVTNNRASMPRHLHEHLNTGGHIPGIFVLNVNMTMGATVDELSLIWELAEPGEFTDQIRYLPIR